MKNGYCKHVSENWNGNPYLCISSASSKSVCEGRCTSLSSCFAYNYMHTTTAYNPCYLIPSNKSCPSGFTDTNGPTVSSMNDLKVIPYSDWDCYEKI